MVLAESLARVSATLLAIARNRVELVATEVEEETLRYFSYLMLSLVAMFCVGIAVVLGVMLAIVLYWETHRVGILVTLMITFAFIGGMIGLRVWNQYRLKPKLLGHTMAELARDTELLQPPA